VVPLLVLLPLVSNTGDGGGGDIMATLVPTFLKAGLGLGLLLYGGRTVLRRLFEIVSESKSPEAFIALCLLTVTGTSVITTQLGLSSTLGAFMAGALSTTILVKLSLWLRSKGRPVPSQLLRIHSQRRKQSADGVSETSRTEARISEGTAR